MRRDGYTTCPYRCLGSSISGCATTACDTTLPQPSLIRRHLPQRLHDLSLPPHSFVLRSCITITLTIPTGSRCHLIPGSRRLARTNLLPTNHATIPFDFDSNVSLLGLGAPPHALFFMSIYLPYHIHRGTTYASVVLSRLRLQQAPNRGERENGVLRNFSLADTSGACGVLRRKPGMLDPCFLDAERAGRGSLLCAVNARWVGGGGVDGRTGGR